MQSPNILSTDSPHIELYSNSEALIEGSLGILQYTPSCLRINCGKIIVKIIGSGMTIGAPAKDAIVVRGTILSLEYC